MANPAERPTNYQSNPNKYLEDHPGAIADKDLAYDVAIAVDFYENRTASLRLGIEVLIRTHFITQEGNGDRHVITQSDLETLPGMSSDAYEALMEDASVDEIKPIGGTETFSIDHALSAIHQANQRADKVYALMPQVMEELKQTKR